MERVFADGSRFAELYETAQGLVIVEGAISIRGKILTLSDLLVDAFETPRLSIGPAAVYAIRRKIMQQAKDEGYTVLELTGIRISGANPNRPILLRRFL